MSTFDASQTPPFIPTLTDVVDVVTAESEAEEEQQHSLDVEVDLPALEETSYPPLFAEGDGSLSQQAMAELEQQFNQAEGGFFAAHVDVQTASPGPVDATATIALSEAAEVAASTFGTAVAEPAPRLLSEDFEEQIVHRVMQRVDTMLVDRVNEAINQVIEQQTRSLLPRLREEVEFAVRKSVYEAVADELLDLAEKPNLT